MTQHPFLAPSRRSDIRHKLETNQYIIAVTCVYRHNDIRTFTPWYTDFQPTIKHIVVTIYAYNGGKSLLSSFSLYFITKRKANRQKALFIRLHTSRIPNKITKSSWRRYSQRVKKATFWPILPYHSPICYEILLYISYFHLNKSIESANNREHQKITIMMHPTHSNS